MAQPSCNRQTTLVFKCPYFFNNFLFKSIVQEFNPIWFLPPTSYLRQWFEASDTFFPSDGERWLFIPFLQHSSLNQADCDNF